MGEIYCLYSSDDGLPRYVGQTEETAARRRRKHIARALELEGSQLYDWMRQVFAAGHDVRAHVLQTAVPPCDLDLFERYWMGQFAGLLNARRDAPAPEADTQIGKQVTAGIQAQLKAAASSE